MEGAGGRLTQRGSLSRKSFVGFDWQFRISESGVKQPSWVAFSDLNVAEWLRKPYFQRSQSPFEIGNTVYLQPIQTQAIQVSWVNRSVGLLNYIILMQL